MSKEASREQILEVIGQIKSRRISGWVCQALIEEAPKIAFQYLVKKIVEQAKESILSPDENEAAMTLIAIASITRDSKDINKAREFAKIQLGSDSKREAIAFMEIASITREEKDVDVLRQLMDENRLSDYYLVKAYVLLGELTGKIEFIDAARAEAKQIRDLYFRTKAWVAIYNSYNNNATILKIANEALEDIYFNVIQEKPENGAQIVAAMCRWRKDKIDRAHILAGDICAQGSYVKYARLAAVTKNPNHLEIAYLFALSIDKDNFFTGAAIWRQLVQLLAGIDC